RDRSVTGVQTCALPILVEESLIIYNIHEGERISGDPYKKLKARKYIYDKFKYEIKKHPRINSLKKLYLAQSYAKLNNKRKKWRRSEERRVGKEERKQPR